MKSRIILILINALFAAAEIAFISLNEAKIEMQVKNGNKKAKTIQNLQIDLMNVRCVSLQTQIKTMIESTQQLHVTLQNELMKIVHVSMRIYLKIVKMKI